MREIRRMEDKLEELYRKIDARIRGLARQHQPSRTEQPRERTQDGRPVCFSCGRTGHLQSSCQERRSSGPQTQHQQLQYQPSYSSNPNYNQPRDNYGNVPQSPRREQRLAVLAKGLYDDEFVAPFKLGTGQKASFNPVEEAQHVNGTEKQENIQIHSADAVLFSKQQLITERNSQARATHGSPTNRCSAARSERKLPGHLETKPKPKIRQHLVTIPLDPNQPSGIQVNDPPLNQEKHDLSGIVPFPNAARRTKTQITADTGVIVDLRTDDNVERSSDPDPTQPQQSTSGGSESTVVNNGSSPNCAQDPHQTASELRL